MKAKYGFSVHSVTLLVVLVILFAATWILATPFLERSKDYKWVGNEFGGALVHNYLGLAKTFTTPDLWGRLDKWMSHRKGFSCPFIFDWDTNNEYIPSSVETNWGGRTPDIGETASFNYDYYCSSEVYSASVYDVQFEYRHQGWVITGWSNICESWNGEQIKKCEFAK